MPWQSLNFLCRFKFFTSLYNLCIHNQSHLLWYMKEYVTDPSWSLTKVLLLSVAQANRTRLSSSAQSFSLWSKNEEVWAWPLKLMLSQRDCSGGCFIGRDLASEEWVEGLWYQAQPCCSGSRLQSWEQCLCTWLAAAILNWMSWAAFLHIALELRCWHGPVINWLKGQVRGLWTWHLNSKGAYMMHKGKG